MATILGIVGAGVSAANSAGAFSSGSGGAPDVKTPEAALYKPVDFDAEQLNTIMGNLNNLPQIGQLVNQSGNMITSQAIKRAQKLIPGYSGLMQLMGTNATNLLSGHLPYQDALDVVSNRAGLTSSLGVPGTSQPGTLKDLGISQLEGMKTGSSMLNQMVGMAQTISPIDRYMTPQMMMLNPMDRIRATMEQNQLIQQSEQNANNLAAIGSSNLMPGGGGGGFNAGGLASGLGQIGGMLGGMGSGTGTAGYAGAPSNLATPSSSIYSSWGTGPQTGTYYAPHSSFAPISTGLTYA